jgi:microcystin-dependent protein
MDHVLDALYPIGSVYHSTLPTDPGTHLGGTWARVAEGRFIASVGTHTDANGDAGNLAAGDIAAGTYKHTLTEAEMPAHTHSFEFWLNSADGGSVRDALETIDGNRTTSSTGGDQPHNNIPPGYGMYVWERTA